MNLGDLLDELRGGILHDFSDQVAGSVDYLWSDKRLIRYINEAQNRFARESLCIRDGVSPGITVVQLCAGQNDYSLHEKVIAVISAKYNGDTADLARAGHSAFSTYYKPDGYFFDTSYLSGLNPGKVLAFDTDEFILSDSEGTMQRMNFHVYPIPAVPYTDFVQLRVVRLPLVELTTGSYTQVTDMPINMRNALLGIIPEVPEQHHLDMLDWAAHLALRIVDHDEGDPDRAAEFKASFEEKVKNARDLAMRKFFAPSLWGFGRNGFSWESNQFA